MVTNSKLSTTTQDHQNVINLQSGINLEQFLNTKQPQKFAFKDIHNIPLNIIYLHDINDNSLFPNEFAVASEFIVSPIKFNFLSKVVKKPDNIKPFSGANSSKFIPIIKKALSKSIIFNMGILYPYLMDSFKIYSKQKVLDELTSLLNTIIKDLKTKNPERKNILILQDDNIKEIKNITTINSLLILIKYISQFNINLELNDIEAIVYYYDQKFYPLTFPIKKDEIQQNNPSIKKPFIFNKLIIDNLIKLRLKELKQLSSEALHNIDLNTDEEDLEYFKEDDRNKINNLSERLNKKLTNIEKEDIEIEIKNILQKYPGKDIREKLEHLFKPVIKINEKKSQDDKSKTIKKIQLDKIIVNDNQLGSNSKHLDINDIHGLLTKQVFDPLTITNLKSISNVFSHQIEFSTNMDKNIKNIAKVFEANPKLNIKVLDIKSKLVDDYKNRYIEYSMKIQHNYGRATNKPYNIIFRIPALVNEKYNRLGGNNYIMAHQLYPKPIQKVNNTTARLYTHYNTTSVILKGSKLDNKSILDIEQKIFDDLIASKILNKNNLIKITTEEKELLMEYGCDSSVSNLQYNVTIDI